MRETIIQKECVIHIQNIEKSMFHKENIYCYFAELQQEKTCRMLQL